MDDAKRFYEALILRLEKFNLEVAKEKTKIIKLNKGNDDNNSNIYGNSFDFLGFTHYVGKDRNGNKRVKRKTSKKKFRTSLLRCKEWIKANRILPTNLFMKTIIYKIQGHCNYYGIIDNIKSVENFIDKCIEMLVEIWLYNI